MKSSQSTCLVTDQRCANCGNIVKPGSVIVTTVIPGRVTIAHETCPMPFNRRPL